MEEVHYINLDDIIPNRFQPREVFDDAALNELADSIREHGVIQPITVRPVGNKYEIICGERRYKASTLAGLTQIPCLVKQMDDKESSIVAFIENCQRKNVSVIEEARTSERILKSNNMTQQELAQSLGISQSALANKLRLLSLPQEIQDALMRNEISERHARCLLGVNDVREQLSLLDEIRAKKMPVRELEALIKNRENGTDININNDEGNYSNNENNNIGESLNNMFIKEDAFDIPKMESVQEDTAVEEAPTTVMSGDREFISFLNNYDNEVLGNQFITPTDSNTSDVDQRRSDTIENYVNNQIEPIYETKNQFIDSDYVDSDNNERVNNTQYENSTMNGYVDNNYSNADNNDDFNDSAYINSDYVEVPNPVVSFDSIDKIDNGSINESRTMPKYVEDDSRFVDISKYNGLNSIDEILKELKAVTDKIKSSKFKVDTEEIDFDDMYQITIKVDKNESF